MKVFKPDDGIASIEKNIPDAMTKDRATLLEQAQSFLDDQTIRNSSDEKKMAFLQSKGLRVEEAEKLLSSIGEAKPASSAREEVSGTSRKPFAELMIYHRTSPLKIQFNRVILLKLPSPLSWMQRLPSSRIPSFSSTPESSSQS